jgi:kynurenine 3-monooxygenase
LNFTKSINLALSERGINALRSSGDESLLDEILKETLPMHGRMVHVRNAAGKIVEDSQLYDVHGRFQRSVDRGMLNKIILNALEKLPNVKLLFQHKLTGADLIRNKAWFEVQQPNAEHSSGRAPEIEVDFDFIVGADGAHSATRNYIMKYARMDYTQVYIDCLWCEFNMPPSENNNFRISPSHLHIWPGGSFMFIALPNTDKSFTCTFFGPVALFRTLESAPSSELVQFFTDKFPGLANHISPSSMSTQFHQNPHLPLLNIKCTPHHFSHAVILGDAANAIVPFYGQGMNAGLESVRVLFSFLDSEDNLSSALESYTANRVTDTHAIADLALSNYIEMRSSVTSPMYKLRKAVEEMLDKWVPNLDWATQYSRVSFGNMRYSEVIGRARYQKQVLTAVFSGVVGSSLVFVLLLVLRFVRRRRQQRN